MIAQGVIQQWRTRAPWFSDVQIEQDLVLSRAMVEIFNHPLLSSTLALRGGTSFNKLYVPQGSRYSEDIDLVQVKAESIGKTLDAIRSLIDPWLGEPLRKASKGNASLRYRFTAEGPTAARLSLKIEINTREHFAVFGYAKHAYAMDSPWFKGSAEVVTYELNELLGTKMRALYQRKKGRDLFDLWRGLGLKGVKPAKVVEAFSAYMKHGGFKVSAKEYTANLAAKMKNELFVLDSRSLLARDSDYDPDLAAELVLEELIARLD